MVEKSIALNAPVSKVWDALTNPAITRTYFFDCEAISEWNAGSAIEFKMEADGKETIAVKGVITAIEPLKLLQYTCFMPEFEKDTSRHTTVTYRLSSENNTTELVVTQGPYAEGDETYEHTDSGWDHVLAGLKKAVEESAT